jgi:hypothetical protein
MQTLERFDGKIIRIKTDTMLDAGFHDLFGMPTSRNLAASNPQRPRHPRAYSHSDR